MAITTRDILKMAFVLIDEVTETGIITSETDAYYQGESFATHDNGASRVITSYDSTPNFNGSR